MVDAVVLKNSISLEISRANFKTLLFLKLALRFVAVLKNRCETRAI